mmetsp:Transcript_28025/g.32141  ORF Transcript_28025/g.32141 Transcript_28025/m.32141 type:complete len:217 (-) Transcript_28025:47-697(-)
MSIFAKSEQLSQAVVIINRLDDEIFNLFLDRVIQGLGVRDQAIFNEKELKQLEKKLKVEDEEIYLLIKAVSYIYQHAAYKRVGSKFKKHIDTLGLTEDKVQAFIEVWQENSADLVQRLREQNICIDYDLQDFDWKVIVPMSYSKPEFTQNAYEDVSVSKNKHQDTKPKIKLNLKVTETSTEEQKGFAFEIDRSKLQELFDSVEKIQGQIDNLSQNP